MASNLVGFHCWRCGTLALSRAEDGSCGCGLKRYVLGFLFADDGLNVLVTRKTHPSWQAGKLNGIGGHIEAEDKSPLAAMVREGREEAGVVADWMLFAVMQGADWRCHCFRAFADRVELTINDAGEPLFYINSERLPPTVIPNLRWLIPLALDSEPKGVQRILYSADVPESVEVRP